MEPIGFTCECGHQWTDLFPVNEEGDIEISDDVCPMCGRQCDPDDEDEE